MTTTTEDTTDHSDAGDDDQLIRSKSQHVRDESSDIIGKMKTSISMLQVNPSYLIDPKKHFGFFRGYMRQDWNHVNNVDHHTEEQRAEWIELFFDLIFVACIVHISSEAAYSIPDASGSGHRRLGSDASEAKTEDECHSDYDFLYTCFAQFGLLTLFWIEQTLIETHFVFNQKMDYFLRLMFMAFILSAGLFIHNDPGYHVAFQVSYIGIKVVCIMIYTKASLIPRAKIHAIWHIIVSSIIILALIGVCASFRGCAMDYFIIYCVFYVFEYMAHILEWTLIDQRTGHLMYALPLHVAHVSERFGLFIMLILGESIISIITADLGEFKTHLILNIGFVICTFFMAFFLATLYFDCQPSEEDIMHGTNNHALKTTNLNRLFFIWGHQLLFFGLLAFGIGIKIGAKHLFDEVINRAWIDVLLPGYGLVVVVVALFCIRLAHPHRTKKRIIWVARIAILIVMCVMPLFAILINQGIIFAVMFLCIVVLNAMDVEGTEKRQKMKQELKDRREKARTSLTEQF